MDDFTRYTLIYPLHLKSEAATICFLFRRMIERQFDTKVKCFQFDLGGEFRKLQPIFQELGIQFRHPCSHTHQKNGKVERKHPSIVEIGLTLLAQASMDLKFLWEAFDYATYLLSHLPSPVLKHISPFKSLYGRKTDYAFLKVFGCACFPYLQPYNKHKLSFKTSKCLFVGYSPFHKGYKCLHPSRRVYIARSVCFNESCFPYQSLFAASSSTNASKFAKTYNAPTFILPHVSSTTVSLTSSKSCLPSLDSNKSLSSFTSTHTYDVPCILVPTGSPLSSTKLVCSMSSPISSDSNSQLTSNSSNNNHENSYSSSTHAPVVLPSLNSTHPMQTKSKFGIFKPKLFSTEYLQEPPNASITLTIPH